jgi:hypothetical protein
MTVTFSVLRVGRPLPPGQIPVLISVRDSVDLRNIVRLERLARVKEPVTSSGIEPKTTPLILLQFKYVRFESDFYVC